MTAKRDRWAQYAAAALSGACARAQDFETQSDECRRGSACDNADSMLEAEERRFGSVDADAELLEDDVRTLEERTAQLKLERDEARARAAELDAALAAVANEGERQLAELRTQLAGSVPVAWTPTEPLMDGYFWLRHPTGNPTPGIVEILTVAGEPRVWALGASDGRLLSELDDGFEWAGPLAAPVAAEQRAAAATPATDGGPQSFLVDDEFVRRDTEVPAAPASKLTILGTPADIMRGNAAEEWVYSTDEEHFGSGRYPSADEAFAAWQYDDAPAPGERVFIGRVVGHSASDFARFGVEMLSEAACEDNEHADGWPDSTPEQDRELEAMVADAVDEWADKHGLQPKFYTVDDVQKRTFEPDEGGDA